MFSDNPATLIIEKLQMRDDPSLSEDWNFVYCALLAIENDGRAFRDQAYTNWPDDVLDRIIEVGVEPDTPALLIFKQLLSDLKTSQDAGGLYRPPPPPPET